ncbi:MAG: DEAD/DEAH box helicase family protein [Polyangiaceae bacterium]|nr:DEAD/DEAH box helicase family protein [Polyangiaceae bacterium]
MTVRLQFVAGTLEIRGLPENNEVLPASVRWDPRTGCHRAAAITYADVMRALVRKGVPFEDEAKRYNELPHGALAMRQLRPYQAEALEAWLKYRSAGVVVLPTGAGKTMVAMAAIDKKRRSTLVIAPTLDLVRQWYDQLRATFGGPVGVIGGGDYDVQDLTVSTYDSAHMYMENLGNRFGLLIYDEAHHLPGPAYALSARLAIAPFRLGLTATPERTDGRETELVELIGPTVYRRDIVELSGDYLADYETVRITVSLTPEELALYQEERAIYRGYLDAHGIRFSSQKGWSNFVMQASRTIEGRRALQAYRRQRELALAPSRKMDEVARLLHEHRHDRTILFTQDNTTAYEISRRFLVPTITHQTKVKERSEILARFADGSYNAVATSKVLNEGVDVPDANVAIVISGSGTVREHVQRLGRILRKKDGKRAILYELVSADTVETFTSERRREHSAYRIGFHAEG